MTYLDLFSGCGCIPYAMRKLGIPITKHIYSEIDKYAIQNYRYNYPKSEYAGAVEDILQYLVRSGEKPDFISFGWPCQDNSISGKRRGHATGTRSGLLTHAVDVIRYSKPRNFLAENVEGLRTVRKGTDIIEAIRLLADLSEDVPQYDIEMQLVNTSWWLPQNRQRLFFVGHLREGRDSGEIFPIGNRFEKNSQKNIQQSDCSGTINTKNNSGQLSLDSGTVLVVSDRGDKGQFIVKENIIGALSSHDGCGFDHAIIVINDNGILRQNSIVNTIDANYHKGMDNHSQRSHVLSKNYERGKSQGGRVYTTEGVAPILLSSTRGLGDSTGLFEIGDRVRRLMPIECERLQGLPDDWTKYGIDENGNTVPISDTQRYKMIGNGISIPPIKEILMRIFKN